MATSTQFLPDLLPFASYLGQRFGCQHVIGIGEYATQNLIHFHPQFKITGIVNSAGVETHQTQFPLDAWVGWGNENRNVLQKQVLERSLIILTGVLDKSEYNEHVLNNLKQWLDHAPVCILTADVKDVPEESKDKRAQSLANFNLLLEKNGFKVEFTGWTTSDAETQQQQTMLAVVTNSQKSVAALRGELSTPVDFRVVAFMAAYNEEDIIVQSIRKWTDQGVAVHVIENWSTDNTFALINTLTEELPVTVERFPATGPSKHFDWGAILKRIETLSIEIKADWFVRRGADEVLASPWPGLNYRDSLYLVDRAGFNCVDHTVINFCPVDNAFPPGADHEAYFRHFEFSQAPADFSQIKTWKNYSQSISMVESGGHDLEFESRRVYPFKFLLKHYPVRSQAHGEKKVFRERKERFNPDEKARGWHTHYDQMNQGHSFVYSQSALTIFDECDFNQTCLVERLSGIGITGSPASSETNSGPSVDELKARLEKSQAELETVKLKLNEIEAAAAQYKAKLEKITNSSGWRLLNRYGPIKYKLVLPVYRRACKLFGIDSNQ